MKYCPRCSVALGEAAVRCPLCGSPSVDEKPPAADSGGLAYPDGRTLRRGSSAQGESSPAEPGPEAANPLDQLNSSDRRKVAFELLSVAYGIALAVSTLADLFASHRMGWSRYSSLGIAAAWLLTALPVLLARRPRLLLVILAPALPALVFLLDAFDGNPAWFLRFGLPIVLSLEACAAAAAFAILRSRRKGLNVIGIALAAVAAFCAALEGVLDLGFRGTLEPGWSVVVAFALIPTAGILFYLHYRIVHRASLKKLFRL